MNIKKLLGYALGPIGGAAASAVALPLISWYFPADDIGRIVLLQTVSSLVLIVLGLGLDQAYIREYHAADNRAGLLKAVLVLPLAFIAAAVLLVGVFDRAWPSEIILELNSASVGLLCLIFMATMLLSRYLSVVLRMQERAYAFSFSQLTPKILILVIVLAYMLTGAAKSTFNLILAYTLAQILTTLVLLLQTKSELARAWRAPFDCAVLKEALRYGIPLAFGGLAYWGLVSVDRFLLKQYGTLSELGVYSMAISFGAVALIFQSIFSTIWAPMVFRWVKEEVNLDKIGSIVALMLSLMAAILCLVGLFSPLVPLLLPPKYAPVQFILLSSILFPLLYTLTEVTGIGINISKKTWLITLISVIALLCNLALCRLLIPQLGAKGAAMATAISFWLYFVLKTEASMRLWQKLPRLSIYGITLACLLFCLAYTYWGSRDNYMIFAAAWLVLLFLLIVRHKPQLQQLAALLKGRLKTH